MKIRKSTSEPRPDASADQGIGGLRGLRESQDAVRDALDLPALPRLKGELRAADGEAARQAAATAIGKAIGDGAIGGAKASRASALSHLAVRATPQKPRDAAATWATLIAAIDRAPGTTEVGGPGIAGVLDAMGFEALGEKKGRTRFARGAERVELRPFTLGDATAIELAYEAPGKKGKKGKKEPTCFGGVHLNGVTLPPALFRRLRDRFELELARFVKAVERGEAKTLPRDFEGLKATFAAGRSKSEQKADAAKAAEIGALLDGISARLVDLKAAGQAPRGIVIYAAGPDGAGKSSTGAIVMDALEKAGYAGRREVFKAPSAEERKQHWLARFERGVPKTGEAVFWDRGPAGDAVYGPVDDARRAVMAKEFEGFETELRSDGILLVKIELSAELDKQADTFGKRLARRYVADQIKSKLEADGTLSAEAAAGLDDAGGRIDMADFAALARYEGVQDRFMKFVDATGDASEWVVVDATKRHGARKEILDRFDALLSEFVSAPAVAAAV